MVPLEVILHVGPHKTGSTALQRMFLALQDEMAREGVLYPRSGMIEVGHHLLVEHFQGRPAAFDAGAFSAEIEGARRVLISSENLVVASEAALEGVKALFPGARFRVVYYLRRLAELWPSHWQEMVKHGQTMSFPEYIVQSAMGRAETGAGALNQLDQLDKLAHVFGAASIEIIGYDRLRADGEEIGAHLMCRVLGLDRLAETCGAPIANLSLPAWQLELLRLTNALQVASGHRAGGTRLREQVLHRLRSTPPSWLPDFRQAVEKAPLIELRSEGPLIGTLQSQVVDRFGSLFTGDRDAVAAAYLEPMRVGVRNFELPLRLTSVPGSDLERFLQSVWAEVE